MMKYRKGKKAGKSMKGSYGFKKGAGKIKDCPHPEKDFQKTHGA